MQFNPGTAGVIHDPDDGLFKMWYWQGLAGEPFNTSQVLCYAESKDALHWEKPLREDCLPFQGHTATNIVHPDVSQSGLALNHDRADSERKYLLVNWPPETAAKRPPGSHRLSTVDASPDGIHWHTISEESPLPHHHEQKIIWDESIQRYIGYSQYSHHQNFLYRKRQIGRQESADFIHWSPKEVVLSADWDPNLPPDLEMHDMSVRKVGGLYIGIASEFMAEPFWQERSGHNWRDQAFSSLGLYTSRNGKRWQRVGGPEPWVDTGSPGDQDYGFACFTPAGELVHGGKIVIPYSANPQKQSWFLGSPPHAALPARGVQAPAAGMAGAPGLAGRARNQACGRRPDLARGWLGQTPTGVRIRRGVHKAVRLRRRCTAHKRRVRLWLCASRAARIQTSNRTKDSLPTSVTRSSADRIRFGTL